MQAPALDAPAADWLVYGDALQEAGDPRGELIGLSHAVAEGKMSADVRDAYVKQHAAALLSHAAPFLDTFRFEWRFCVPVAATMRFTSSTGDRDLMLLESPLGEQLRAITLVGDTSDRRPVDLEPMMKRLVSKRPPSLRSFSFVDERAQKASMLISRDYGPGANLVALGSLVPFYSFAEQIHLVVADSHQLELTPMDAPELRAFTLDCLRFAGFDEAGPMPGRLIEMEAPKLERYALRLTESYFTNIAAEDNPYIPVYTEYFDNRRAEHEAEQEDRPEDEREEFYDRSDEGDEGELHGADWNALDALLAVLATYPLKHLALTGFASSRSLVEVIDTAGLAPTLEVLDLSDSQLDNDDAAWMASRPKAFAAPKKIVVDGTRLTAAGAATLKKLGPEIEWSSGGTQYRYIVGSE